MPGNGRCRGEAGRFNADQLDDLREVAIGFDDKVGNAFTVAGNEFRAQARVSDMKVLFLDLRNHRFYVSSKLRDGYAIALVVVLAVDIFGGGAEKQRTPQCLREV